METSSNQKPEKPLGYCAYGSISHLPGSRCGPSDKGLSEHQARILTEKKPSATGFYTNHRLLLDF